MSDETIEKSPGETVNPLLLEIKREHSYSADALAATILAQRDERKGLVERLSSARNEADKNHDLWEKATKSLKDSDKENNALREEIVELKIALANEEGLQKAQVEELRTLHAKYEDLSKRHEELGSNLQDSSNLREQIADLERRLMAQKNATAEVALKLAAESRDRSADATAFRLYVQEVAADKEKLAAALRDFNSLGQRYSQAKQHIVRLEDEVDDLINKVNAKVIWRQVSRRFKKLFPRQAKTPEANTREV